MELISIHDSEKEMSKKYYGASRKVFRGSDVKKLLKIWGAIKYLDELYTRTRLVPCNKEFLYEKAIPHYNSALKQFKLAYPNIKEIQNYKPIEKIFDKEPILCPHPYHSVLIDEAGKTICSKCLEVLSN
jgi:hypothetical protein